MKYRWSRREVSEVMGAQSFMSQNGIFEVAVKAREFEERWEGYSIMALEETLLDSEELDLDVPLSSPVL